MIRFSNYISEDAHELIFKPQDDLKEPDYDDIEIFKDSWVKIKLPTPPREDREIDAVIDAVNTATDEQKAEYENCDKDASYYVKKVLRENSLEYDEDVIEYIEEQCVPIVRHYKNYYNRPRPYQVAAIMNKELKKI